MSKPLYHCRLKVSHNYDSPNTDELRHSSVIVPGCSLMPLLTWSNVSSLIADWSHTVNKPPCSLTYCKWHHWHPIIPRTLVVPLQPTLFSLSLCCCCSTSFWADPICGFLRYISANVLIRVHSPLLFQRSLAHSVFLHDITPNCEKTFPCGHLCLTGTTNHNTCCHCVTASIAIFPPFHLLCPLFVCVSCMIVFIRLTSICVGIRLSLFVHPVSLCSHQADSRSPNHNLIYLGQINWNQIGVAREAALGQIFYF